MLKKIKKFFSRIFKREDPLVEKQVPEKMMVHPVRVNGRSSLEITRYGSLDEVDPFTFQQREYLKSSYLKIK